MDTQPLIITRSKGGTAECRVPLSSIIVPDCWHAAMQLAQDGHEEHKEAVLDCWHLCHDLLRTLKEH